MIQLEWCDIKPRFVLRTSCALLFGVTLLLTARCGSSSTTGGEPIDVPDTTALTDTLTDADGLTVPDLGKPDMDSAMEKCANYTLEGVADKIKMPICITHGQDDNIVPVEMAHRLFAACGSEEKELKIFTVEEDGGSQHCVFDNLHMVRDWIGDWWMDRFGTGE